MKKSETTDAYVGFFRSVVFDLEQFLQNVDTNDIVITDEDVQRSFRNIGKTLQRIFNKWDRKKTNDTPPEKRPAEEKPTPKKMSKSLIDESFLYDDKIETSNNSANHQEITSFDLNNIIPTKPNDIDLDLIEKLKRRVRKDIEESDDEMESKENSDSNESNSKASCDLSNPVLEKVTELVYKCKACSVELPKNNVGTHLNGKSHKKSVSKYVDDGKIDLCLDGVKLSLREDKSGREYIVTRNSTNEFYYCKLCKVEISKTATNLMQHITGQTHRRLCVD